jgi:calcium-dependent protein kinase
MGTKSSIETKGVFKEEYVKSYLGQVHSFYKIKSHLGIGGISTIYLAEEVKTGLPRAIKEVRRVRMTKQKIDALKNEIGILKKLDHPNIMKIYEIIESPYAFFIVCEPLTGGSLMEKILGLKYDPSKNVSNRKEYVNQISLKIKSKDFGIDEETAKKYMKDILYALSYCHSQNIVHNDIKPDNFVFENDSETPKLKLIDFGIANHDPSETDEENIGQIHYRAPETFENLIYGHESGISTYKSDVWGAGIIMFILLARECPIKGTSEKSVKSQLKKGLKGPINNIIASEPAKELLKKMLRIDPKKRISASDALKDPWFCEDEEINEKNLKDTIELMKNFKVI